MDTLAPITAPVSPAAVTMESFFTRERANEGIELSLDLPDGTPTAHKIRIRGVDSDSFRVANAESKRRLVDLAMSKEKATLDLTDHENERFRLLASLVVSWTFETPCNPENVVRLLREAPQLAEQIDRLAAKRTLFFRNGSPSSTPSLPQNLS